MKFTQAQLNKYKPMIEGRMLAENCHDLTDSEIKRCLEHCVASHKLIPMAKELRNTGNLFA